MDGEVLAVLVPSWAAAGAGGAGGAVEPGPPIATGLESL
jgi:hypothetical protein